MFIVIGGPDGKDEEQEVLLICNTLDESEIRARLYSDPWNPAEILRTRSVEKWTPLLTAGRQGEI
jgi:hypothetical protein